MASAPQTPIILVLLAPSEVAAMLRVSPRKLRAMKAAGEIPKPVRFGRLVRWRRSELER